jgi:hypothetical protein
MSVNKKEREKTNGFGIVREVGKCRAPVAGQSDFFLCVK